MKTIYIDCQMGAAGDMLMGALLELVPDRKKFLKKRIRQGSRESASRLRSL